MNNTSTPAHRPDQATWTITILDEESQLVHLNAGCICGDDHCSWAIDAYASDQINYHA